MFFLYGPSYYVQFENNLSDKIWMPSFKSRAIDHLVSRDRSGIIQIRYQYIRPVVDFEASAKKVYLDYT